MASIDIDHLVKVYDNGFKAVKSISLPIRDKEFMVLVGPSGCGKTTTLRMIAGLEDITGGEIRIDTRRINEVEPKDRDIAMVFQNYALYPHMTVFENMAYALKLRGMKRAEIQTKVDETAKMLGLTDHLPKLPKQLSGGQRQRVALGRAIVRKPKVFLFDEPLSNLDAKLRGEMRYELKTLQQKLATTAVYVTHDQIEAMTLGDRITVMSAGEIQQVAAPTVIYDSPYNRFVASFIGTPVMNFLDGTLTGADQPVFKLPGDAAIALAMPERHEFPSFAGKPIVLGIRPEQLSHGGYTALPKGGSTIPMQVTLLEIMGDHQYVYLKRPGFETPIVMKCNAHHRAAVGETIPIHIDTTMSHAFEPGGDQARNLTLPKGFTRQA
ncbi:sugar ABC transporter ATP-binding protein [Planctomycetota bacterium]|nr:sugar ABC transporter ATP-binding protein [Planctomycetota bacterium]